MQNLLPTLSENGLNRYVRVVNCYPILTAQQERQLMESWIFNQDLAAVKELVLCHLRFVVKVAREFTGYGLAQADLIQEGNIGLMKAVQRFNLKFKVRLITFAIHWIKASIYNYIVNNWRMVKIATTKAQRKLFFNLRKLTQALLISTGTTNKEDAISERLQVPLEQVHSMQTRLASSELSIDQLLAATQGDKQATLQGGANALVLSDPHSDFSKQIEEQQWQAYLMKRMQAAFQRLDPRSQEILKHRWLEEPKPTLQELSEKYQISAERVRQISDKAFKTFRADCLAQLPTPARKSKKPCVRISA